MAATKIEWTECTWNPVTGCSRISPGCAHCYAERMAVRLKAMGQPNYANGFEVTCHERTLRVPLSWKRPSMVFVNSMGDLFHEDVPDEFIRRVFSVMARADWHTFQVLTKRSERLAEIAPSLKWTPNIWAGVSVENADYLHRVEHLRCVPAAVRFLSLEPLLAPVEGLALDGIKWVIVGGESGPGARPLAEEWVVDVRDLCLAEGVPFFFKQWGGTCKKKAGRVLRGREWDQTPRLPRRVTA
jgi:protein gp37